MGNSVSQITQQPIESQFVTELKRILTNPTQDISPFSALNLLQSKDYNGISMEPIDPQLIYDYIIKKSQSFENLVREAIILLEKNIEITNSTDQSISDQITLCINLVTVYISVLANMPQFHKTFSKIASNIGFNQKLLSSSKSDSTDSSDEEESQTESSDEETPKKQKQNSKSKGKNKQSKHDDESDSYDEPKAKKSQQKRRKQRKDEDSSETEVKKKVKRTKDTDSEDDSEDQIKSKKKIKKQSKKTKDSDSEDDIEEKHPSKKKTNKHSKKTRDLEDDDSEEEIQVKKKGKKETKKAKDFEDDDSEDNKSKKKGKKQSRKTRDSEDESEDEIQVKKKGKKETKKAKDSDSEDESDHVPAKKLKNKKQIENSKTSKSSKKKYSKDDNSDEESESEDKKKTKKSSKTTKRQSKNDSDSESEEESSDSELTEKQLKKLQSLRRQKELKRIQKCRENVPVLSRFVIDLMFILFDNQLSHTDKNKVWEIISETEFSHAALLRYGVIHSLNALMNLPILFNKSQESKKQLPNYHLLTLPFPSVPLLHSICRLAADFVVRSNLNQLTIYNVEMLRNCLVICLSLVTKESSFSEAFAKIPNQDLINAFFGTPPQLQILIDQFSPISSASLSFFYQTILNNKQFISFIAEQKLSNVIVFSLLSMMQYSYEKINEICYLHSIIFSCLILLTENKEVSKQLVQPCQQSIKGVLFQTKAKTFVDLLIDVCLNFSTNQILIQSILSLFHNIAPYCQEISLHSVYKLLTLFESVAKNLLDHKKDEKLRRLTEIFMEGIALNLKVNINMQILIIQKAPIIRQLKASKIKFNESIDAIVVVLDYAKEKMAQSHMKSMTTEYAEQMLLKADFNEQFEDFDLDFQPQTHVFGGDMKKTWDEWTAILFEKCYEKELKLLKEIH